MNNKFTLVLYIFVATNSLFTFINKFGEQGNSTIHLYFSGIAFVLSISIIVMILKKNWASRKQDVEQ
jgi:hypothetical protein